MQKKTVIYPKKVKFEKNSLPKIILNFFLIPVLNVLPIKSQKLIKESNSAVKEIIENATNHNALEILYHKGVKHTTRSLYNKLAHKVWFNTNNSKAVRNRLMVVKNELEIIFSKLASSEKKETINIVSIAAGSARAVVESLQLVQWGNKKVNVTFVDKNPNALTYSQSLVKDLSLSDKFNFEWINDTVTHFLDTTDKRFTVVEMVGLMDYFEDSKVLSIFKKIHAVTEVDGYFITANINYNSEMHFVTKAIGWPMIYRSAEELGKLVTDAGFPHIHTDIYYEPLKIHSIIVASRR